MMAVAAILLFAAGCGGDDGSASSATSGSLSKAEFIEQASKLCEKTRREFEREYAVLANSGKNSGSPEKLAADIAENVFVPRYEGMIEEIEAIGIPSADEKKIYAFLEAVQRELDRAAAQPLRASQNSNPFAEASKKATAAGIAGCAESL